MNTLHKQNQLCAMGDTISRWFIVPSYNSPERSLVLVM